MNTLAASAIPFMHTRPGLTNLMRWQEPLATRLRYRHSLPGQVANRLLNVELGLYLMADLLPMAPPEALPDLLNGQGVAYRERPVWTPRQHRLLNRARTLLAPYQTRTTWLSALAKYATLPSAIRAYRVTHRPGMDRPGLNAEAGSYVLRERLTVLKGALE